MLATDSRRTVPPLVLAGMLSLVLLAALPSALSIPNQNPTETLEYAPVPPEGEDSPPGDGNVAALGLGSSTGIGSSGSAGTTGGGPTGQASVGAQGKNPSTKRCVGNPPRQTEDPLSPPCVAFFSGDNFGATHRGVTADEARILVYFDSGLNQVTSKGYESYPPPGSFFDLGVPPEGEEFTFLTLLRAYQRHFNERYQTYGRFVRFHVQFARSSPNAESRRADAVDALDRVDPFAVVIQTFFGFGQEYVDVVARRGVVSFLGSSSASTWHPAASFRRFPGQIWSYNPSIEQRAATISSHLCSKLVPHRVSYSGNAGDIGKPRVIGISRTDRPELADKARYGQIIRDAARECGAQIVYEATSPTLDAGVQNAAADVASMRQRGVTTILIAGAGSDEVFAQMRAAGASQWFPEIYLAGDNILENNLLGRVQDQSVWRNTRAVTTYLRVDRIEDQPCFAAAREGDPELNRQDIRNYACDFFPDLRQMFIGIQVAGPRLSPATMDRGYHAIPRVASDNPSMPACFYEPGDYTCVKDAQVQWWDPTGTTSDSGSPGCMRMFEAGRRYLAGRFPAGDVDSQRDPARDPCNIQGRDAA